MVPGSPFSGDALTLLRTATIPTIGKHGNYPEDQKMCRGWFQHTWSKGFESYVLINKNGAVPGFKSGVGYQPPSDLSGAAEYGCFIATKLECLLEFVIAG